MVARGLATIEQKEGTDDATWAGPLADTHKRTEQVPPSWRALRALAVSRPRGAP